MHGIWPLKHKHITLTPFFAAEQATAKKKSHTVRLV